LTFDEIVVGSGLSALGVVLGISASRRVLVIGGPSAGRFVYYDRTRGELSAYVGHGGLGKYWHGVIPTLGDQLPGGSVADFATLMRRFYSNTEITERLGKPWLFVPWRPLRPQAEWRRLKAERGDHLVFLHDLVSRFELTDRNVTIWTADAKHRAERVWVCAGPLHTPALLDRSLAQPVSRQFVSDHVFCYLGRIDRSHSDMAPPRAQRTRDGVWFEGRYDEGNRALYMLRPARFGFTHLDYGIVQRSAVGLSTGKRMPTMVRDGSLGLLAETLYNHFGLFPNARILSVYAQVNVPDAHQFCSTDARLSARRYIIRSFVEAVRANPPWKDLRQSKRPDIFIPSTHLYHSVDMTALAAADVGRPTSRVHVVDASVLSDIGPDHHSFKLAVAAFGRAQSLTTRE